MRRLAEHGREHIERLRELIDRGAPWEACDAFRADMAKAPCDPDVLFVGALAHARAGAIHEAHALLDGAEELARSASATPLLVEILSLRGRLWKDLACRAPDIAAALPFVRRAREQYLAAYVLAKDPFPGVNAATLTFLAGERDVARTLAAEVIATLTSDRGAASAWDLASLGEAQLVVGSPERARQSYAAAYRACNANAGTVASMRRQLTLLARVLPDAAWLLEVIPQVSVVAFAGHMVDAQSRISPRFPPALEGRVGEALRERVAGLRAPIVYASAACGADLLFVEAALDLDAEVNLVLPFDRDDFVRTSVAIGGAAWISRFENALIRAHRVVMATAERYLGDDVLFDHAAREVEGFAILRAAQLETEPAMLCVADLEDVASARHIGGTGAALARWRTGGRNIDVIDLAALRAEPGSRSPRAAGPTVARAVAEVTTGSAVIGVSASDTPRSIRSMLFADIAGYSRLHDSELPRFQRSFLELAASLIERSDVRPLEVRTWGDAVCAIFEGAEHAAEFALRFAGEMRRDNVVTAEEGGGLAIRVALHAGAVFLAFDPVMRRDSHFGANVTRTARIEPITPPGLVYASEAFAATLASGNSNAYALEYIGVLPLAKSYGESRIYRLERR